MEAAEAHQASSWASMVGWGQAESGQAPWAATRRNEGPSPRHRCGSAPSFEKIVPSGLQFASSAQDRLEQLCPGGMLIWRQRSEAAGGTGRGLPAMHDCLGGASSVGLCEGARPRESRQDTKTWMLIRTMCRPTHVFVTELKPPPSRDIQKQGGLSPPPRPPLLLPAAGGSWALCRQGDVSFRSPRIRFWVR